MLSGQDVLCDFLLFAGRRRSTLNLVFFCLLLLSANTVYTMQLFTANTSPRVVTPLPGTPTLLNDRQAKLVAVPANFADDEGDRIEFVDIQFSDSPGLPDWISFDAS